MSEISKDTLVLKCHVHIGQEWGQWLFYAPEQLPGTQGRRTGVKLFASMTEHRVADELSLGINDEVDVTFTVIMRGEHDPQSAPSE